MCGVQHGEAHPRSRGENAALTCRRRATRGSSPLTRGKPIHVRWSFLTLRLIPAHAGKTITWLAQLITSWAHPRSRGENSRSSRASWLHGGSSPLTRGKRMVTAYNTRTGGLIPAHAGKTIFPSFGRRTKPAHPRSRGENRMSVAVTDSGLGSSPLTRGKRNLLAGRNFGQRLIPAHAGKTPRPLFRGLVLPAHPRSRGENCRWEPFSLADDGSSPLTRGKPVESALNAGVIRLIPAHAGKTCSSAATPIG